MDFKKNYISVVMSVFNRAEFLPKSIGSILDQTYRDFEFIIIDDGSTDKSKSVLEHYRKIDSRVKVIYREHEGLVSALNYGCSLAKGEYIARMDSDDFSTKERFSETIAFLNRNSDYVLVGSAKRVMRDSRTEKLLYEAHLPETNAQIQNVLLSTNCIVQPAVMMRAETFNKVGGYREEYKYGNDYDLWLRMIEQGKFYNINKCFTTLTVHANQVSATNIGDQVFSRCRALWMMKQRREKGEEPRFSKMIKTSGDLVRYGFDKWKLEKMELSSIMHAMHLMLLTKNRLAFKQLRKDIRDIVKHSDYKNRSLKFIARELFQNIYYQSQSIIILKLKLLLSLIPLISEVNFNPKSLASYIKFKVRSHF